MRAALPALCSLAVLAICAVTVPARAAETSAESAPRTWYGYQGLFADGGAIAGGIATGGTLFVPAYLLGAPVVHAIHGRTRRGLLDLGLRLGMPLAGAIVLGGSEYLVTRNRGVPLRTFSLIGAAGGAVAAMALDATVLAWDDPSASKKSAFTISPSVRFFGKEKTLGLVGMW